MTGPTTASVPISVPVVRGVDQAGVVVEVRAPTNAQDAVEMRARAREVAGALSDFARWLDDESVVLMNRDKQTLVVGPGGRAYGIGIDNLYQRIADPGALRAELLIEAANPELEGGSRITALIEECFKYVEPEQPQPFWEARNAPLNKVEGLGGRFAAVVQKHRGIVTPREVLKEKR